MKAEPLGSGPESIYHSSNLSLIALKVQNEVKHSLENNKKALKNNKKYQTSKVKKEVCFEWTCYISLIWHVFKRECVMEKDNFIREKARLSMARMIFSQAWINYSGHESSHKTRNKVLIIKNKTKQFLL